MLRKMQLYLTAIIIITNIIPPILSIIQLTFDRFPSRHPNRFRGPGPGLGLRPGPGHRPPFNPHYNTHSRPRFPFRPPPNGPLRRPYPPRPPFIGTQNRPNGGYPNFQPMAHINRPPGNNFQQIPYQNTQPYQQFIQTTSPTTSTTGYTTTTTATTTTTTTTKHPLDSEENVHTLLTSIEQDGTLEESGWPKGKVKPMLKELWPQYKNVKSMLLEKEKARMAMINLRNKYHAKRQRLRNIYHLRPFKNGVY